MLCTPVEDAKTINIRFAMGMFFKRDPSIHSTSLILKFSVVQQLLLVQLLFGRQVWSKKDVCKGKDSMACFANVKMLMPLT